MKERDIKVESDAKNFAYAFIIAKGLVGEFAEFQQLAEGLDPHALCKVLLYAQTEER